MANEIINYGFIEQTALDYNMSEFQVRVIYDNWYDKGLFYEKLDKFIEQRDNYFR